VDLALAAWATIIALVPWGIRIAVGKFPLQRTALDIPLVIFLLTAGVGVWAAYDRAAAWDKFWLIVASVLVYYALAGQSQSNSSLVYRSGIVLGASVSGYFLLTHNQFNSATELRNRMGRADVPPACTERPWIQPDMAVAAAV
jgi:hypothetical protein